MEVQEEDLARLQQALDQSKDQLYEQDKTEIWTLRHEICYRPHLQHYLTHVLQSVKWNSYIDVVKVTIRHRLFVYKPRYTVCEWWKYFKVLNTFLLKLSITSVLDRYNSMY